MKYKRQQKRRPLTSKATNPISDKAKYLYRESRRKTPRTTEEAGGKSRVVQIAGSILILLLVFMYIRVPEVSVTKVGSDEVDQGISDRAGELIASWWGSYSLFDRDEFEKELLNDFSDIERVVGVDKQFFGSLAIEVAPRSAVAFLDTGANASSASSCIDAGGILFSCSDSSASLLPKYVDVRSGLSDGDAVMTSETAEFIRTLSEEFVNPDAASNLRIDSFVASTNIRELQLRLVDKSYTVYLRTEIDSREVAASLVDTVNHLTSNGIPEPTTYLDLRITGEAVYR